MFLRVVSVRIVRNDFYGIFSDFFLTNLLCNTVYMQADRNEKLLYRLFTLLMLSLKQKKAL